MSLLLMFLLHSSFAVAPVCAFPSPPEVRNSRNGITYAVWELADDDLWLSDTKPASEVLRRYEVDVRTHVDPDPLMLIERQSAIFRGAGYDTRNADAVASGQVGSLAPAHCLDRLLLAEHLASQDQNHNEFMAYVLQHPIGRQIRVHFASYPEWPQNARHSMPGLQPDLDAGWHLRAVIHNHPFFFDNAYGDIAGTPVPSSPDVERFQELAREGLQEARITNGLHTATFGLADFSRLSADISNTMRSARLLTYVHDSCASGTQSLRPVPYIEWSEGKLTNQEGIFCLPRGASQLQVSLKSPFVVLRDAQDASRELSWKVPVGDKESPEWALDVPSDHADPLFYLAQARHWVRSLANPRSRLWLWTQGPLQVTINEQSATCNVAYYHGGGLVFTRSACGNTAQSASIVQHEYGHAVHAAATASEVPVDVAVSEAAADYIAAAVNNNPQMREGGGLCAVIRSCANQLSLCARGCDVAPEDGPYKIAQVVCAAWWDLRQQLQRRYGAVAGGRTADKIFLRTLERPFTWRSAYQQTLAADGDSNEYLFNGTSHACEIQRAFSGRPGQPRFAELSIDAPCREQPSSGGEL